jgi:IclR family pca regulon transcriptional regulator
VRGSSASDASHAVAAAPAGAPGDGAPPPADSTPHERSTDFVQALERGLAVIRAFGPDEPRLTLSDVARRTGLNRAAARRFLLTLVDLGYVHFDGRYFWLRPQVLDLGYSYMATLTTPDVALPYMEDLVARVSASASLTILDGTDVFYVAHVPAKRMLAVRVPIGTRLPAHATSMGHVLLAALPAYERRSYLETAQRRQLTPMTVTTRHELAAALDTVYGEGFAIGDQGLEEDLHGVAVPVSNGRGSIVAALGITTQAGSPTPESLRATYLPPLLESAEQISDQLRRLNMPTTSR